MTSQNKEFCVFHIPTASYLMCHISKQSMALLGTKEHPGLRPFPRTYSYFLLPPGSSHDYDSVSVFLRDADSNKLVNIITEHIKDEGMHYKDRQLEEFEIVEFTSDLVLPHNKWREFTPLGTLKENGGPR